MATPWHAITQNCRPNGPCRRCQIRFENPVSASEADLCSRVSGAVVEPQHVNWPRGIRYSVVLTMKVNLVVNLKVFDVDHLNPVHASMTHFSMICRNIILSSKSVFFKWFLSLGFSEQNVLYAFPVAAVKIKTVVIVAYVLV